MFDSNNLTKYFLNAAERVETEFACRIALAFHPLVPEGGEIGHRANERFHAASTMKVPVMIEVFRQAEAGRFALTDTLEVNPIFQSLHDGSDFEVRGGEYVNSRIGQRETIQKLTEQMIVVSDDLAANLLITLCGPELITATAQALGATQTTVLRCVEDVASFRAGGMNWVTAHDLNVLFEAIETGRAASAAACAENARHSSRTATQQYDPIETSTIHQSGSQNRRHHRRSPRTRESSTLLQGHIAWRFFPTD